MPNNTPARVQLYKSRPTVFHGLFHDVPVGLHLAPLGSSTLHPWVPPPCSPGFLHLAPLGSSTFLPGVAPPSSPLCFTGCFMMLPLASTFLPGVAPPSSPLCFTGCFMMLPLASTLHPWVPPPCTPGSLHLPPRGSSTFLPGVPPPSSPCPSMWTANCPVVLVVTCGNEPNRRL